MSSSSNITPRSRTTDEKIKNNRGSQQRWQIGLATQAAETIRPMHGRVYRAEAGPGVADPDSNFSE